jgi:hypothetical protein
MVIFSCVYRRPGAETSRSDVSDELEGIWKEAVVACFKDFVEGKGKQRTNRDSLPPIQSSKRELHNATRRPFVIVPFFGVI